MTTLRPPSRKVVRFIRRFTTGRNGARSHIEPPPQIETEPSKRDIASRVLTSLIPVRQRPASSRPQSRASSAASNPHSA
jgi:hypothetical protein